MTNAEMAAKLAEAERLLELTTVGWNKVASYPPTKLAGTNWGKARALIDLVQADLLATVPAPPPPVGFAVDAPVGPLAVHDGGGTQEAGEMRYTTGPFKIEKQHYKRFTGWGVYAMQWPEAVSPAGSLQEFYDLITEDVAGNPPGSGGGTKEAGFWFGQRSKAARLAAYRCAWMGYWFGGNCDGSLFEHLLAREMRNVAAYFEHCARNTTVRYFEADVVGDGGWVHPGVVNVEWAYTDGYAKYMPAETQIKYPGRSCAYNLMFEYGRVKSKNPEAPCFMFGPGTFGHTIRNVKLSGPGPGIVYCNNSLHPTIPAVQVDWPTMDTSELTGPREVVRSDLAIG